MNATSLLSHRSHLIHASRALFLAAAVSIVTGCAVTKPSKLMDGDGALMTGSVETTLDTEGVDNSDALAIRDAIAGIGRSDQPAPDQSSALAWNNPQTGHSGTLSAINEIAGPAGFACREFSTTLDSFSGVAVYKGESCQTGNGNWNLSWLKRLD